MPYKNGGLVGDGKGEVYPAERQLLYDGNLQPTDQHHCVNLLAGTGYRSAYAECVVEEGLDSVSVVDGGLQSTLFCAVGYGHCGGLGGA